MSEKKLGKAGRVYSLTEKGRKYHEVLEKAVKELEEYEASQFALKGEKE